MLNTSCTTNKTSPPTGGEVHISGAGPAGLTAAITLAKAGRRIIVHERQQAVGLRFHGDFQGQENWTSGTDLLAELQAMGIEPDYAPTPFHALTAFDADGQAFHFTSGSPLFYLVRRGKERTRSTAICSGRPKPAVLKSDSAMK